MSKREHGDNDEIAWTGRLCVRMYVLFYLHLEHGRLAVKQNQVRTGSFPCALELASWVGWLVGWSFDVLVLLHHWDHQPPMFNQDHYFGSDWK